MLPLPATPHIVVGPCSLVSHVYFAWIAPFSFWPWTQFLDFCFFKSSSSVLKLSSQACSSMKISQIFPSKLLPSFWVFSWHLVPFMMCAVSRCLGSASVLRLLTQYLTNRCNLKKKKIIYRIKHSIVELVEFTESVVCRHRVVDCWHLVFQKSEPTVLEDPEKIGHKVGVQLVLVSEYRGGWRGQTNSSS